MKRKILIATVLLSTARVFAFNFMGPTTSTLKNSGQSSAAMLYFSSDMEMEVDSIPELGLPSFKTEDIDINKTTVNMTLGMGRSSEISLRLGIAEVKPEKGDILSYYAGSSDECFIVGGGAKLTLAEGQKASWGLLAQVSWADYNFKTKSYLIDGFDVDYSTDIEIVEVQIATGPTFQPIENVAVYSGPFLYFLNGDVDMEVSIDDLSGSVSTDLEEDSFLGAYIGTQINITQNVTFNIEYQTTSQSHGVGGQLLWRF